MGLKPITRRVWAKRGQRPIAVQKRGYQWLHSYAFVQPSTGRGEFWVMSHVDTPTMNAVLQAFAKTVNPNNDKFIVLLLDNAGWHISNDLETPEGIRLYFILPYTPELSPAEPIMPLLHEAVANQLIPYIFVEGQGVVDRSSLSSGERTVARVTTPSPIPT
jgi:hypothetical protein